MVDLIAELDDALAQTGQDVVLRRVTDRTTLAGTDVALRAVVRSYRPEELVAGIAQTDSKVILSPTAIATAGWPGGSWNGVGVDPSLPTRNDRVIIAGRVRNVENVDPIYVANILVRIEMQVRG